MIRNKILFAILAISFTLACKQPTKDGSQESCATFNPEQTDDLQNVTLVLELDRPASNVSLEIPQLKYNKQSVFNMEWDDNTRNALDAYDVLKHFSFNDGTGKAVNYTAAIGVNGYTFQGDEIGCGSNDIRYNEYDQLIKAGWDLMSHSNRHTDTGDASINIGSYRQDLEELGQLYEHKTGYRFNCFIVPSSYFGFVPEVENLGYLGSSSSVHHPYRLKHPPFDQVGSISTFDDTFLQLNRDFKDDWTQSQISDVIAKFSDMVDGSDSTEHLFYRLGTHHIEPNYLSSLMTQMQQIGSDKVWFTSLREWLEYRYIRDKVQIIKQVSGNHLTITIDYSSIPAHFRWGDLTLNLKGAKIVQGSSSGADSISYNDGMVNIYQQAAYR